MSCKHQPLCLVLIIFRLEVLHTHSQSTITGKANVLLFHVFLRVIGDALGVYEDLSWTISMRKHPASTAQGAASTGGDELPGIQTNQRRPRR
jgi:hypothetical protein